MSPAPGKSPIQDPSLRMIAAAAIALLVVHGFGRFVFTPLIPLLVDDNVLTLTQAAQLASWNYLGYLLGALSALLAYRWHVTRATLVTALVINVALTGGQLLIDSFSGLALLRLANGISNGLVFVLAPAIVVEVLVRHHKIQHNGFIYLGVGGGIVASDLIISITTPYLVGSERWLPVFAAAIVPMLWAGWQFIRLDAGYLNGKSSAQQASNIAPSQPTQLWTRPTTPLFLAYAGAGLGYILPMTFLPALAADWQLTLTPSAWLITALASIPSVWLWNSLGTRWSDRRALIINYWIQAAGVLAIVVFAHHALALWLCAILVGGTFIGTVSLTQRLARYLQPHQGPRLSAALIALYGVLQLAGPLVTEQFLQLGLSLTAAFVISLIALIFSALSMQLVPKSAQKQIS